MINFAELQSFHFVSELDVLEVTTATNVTVAITAIDNTELLRGTYIPVDGRVRLYHLHKLLSPLIIETVATFTIRAGNTSKAVTVVQSAQSIGETAMEFLPSFFLSSVMTERDTAIGRKELVSILPIEATLPTVSAECSYWDGTAIVTATKAVAATLTAGAVTEIDVSPKKFEDNTLGELVAYEIIAGERRMRYRVATLPTSETAMLFRNTFGAWEALYFAGMEEREPEYTRETAMVNGEMRIYNLEETDTAASHTGPLRPGGIALSRDLARSRDVVLLEKGVTSDAVVITAVAVNYTSADDSIADFTFTWRRAGLLSAKLITARTPRVFDETFDETYE